MWQDMATCGKMCKIQQYGTRRGKTWQDVARHGKMWQNVEKHGKQLEDVPIYHKTVDVARCGKTLQDMS